MIKLGSGVSQMCAWSTEILDNISRDWIILIELLRFFLWLVNEITASVIQWVFYHHHKKYGMHYYAMGCGSLVQNILAC